jgi:hypothetical protein
MSKPSWKRIPVACSIFERHDYGKKSFVYDAMGG